MGLRDWLSSLQSEPNAPPPDVPCKWLPVIAQDHCTGCGACLNACDSCCLDLVWDFATLARPQDCGSEGHCAEACPVDVITMEWVPVTGERVVGVWRESTVATS